MNFGAKVPVGVLPRTDPERSLDESLLVSPRAAMSDEDWLRECPTGDMGDKGASTTLDFDLACPGGGPGDGVPWPWPKGLPLRHRGPSCALELIIAVFLSSHKLYASFPSCAPVPWATIHQDLRP